MVYAILQMGLRGTALMLMMMALYFNSESDDLTYWPHFFMSGVYGAYIVITMALLVEAALRLTSDIFVETSLLALAVIFNIVSCVVAFVEFFYSSSRPQPSSTINKACISVLGAGIYSIDLTFACWYVDRGNMQRTHINEYQ